MAELRDVLEIVRRAADSDGGRTETDRAERPALQKLAHPLQLGEDSGGSFVLSRHWEAEFDRRGARERADGADLPVRTLRSWLGELGLEIRVENLVIATYAELSRRAWVRANQVVVPPAGVDDVRDDMVLRPQPMPDRDDWATAVERVGAILGEKVDARVISPRSVAAFGKIKARVDQLRAPVAELVVVLEETLPRLGVTNGAPRLRTAEDAVRLVDALRHADGPTATVTALARIALDTPPATVGRSIMSAGAVTEALRGAEWQVLDRLATLTTPEALALQTSLRTAAEPDEIAAPLARALGEARRSAIDLLVVHPPKPTPPPVALPPPPADPPPRPGASG